MLFALYLSLQVRDNYIIVNVPKLFQRASQLGTEHKSWSPLAAREQGNPEVQAGKLDCPENSLAARRQKNEPLQMSFSSGTL